MSTDLPDYIVLRAPGFVFDKEGYWYDKRDIPWATDHDPPRRDDGTVWVRPVTAPSQEWEAVPTGRFETRADGAVAEVWEIRLV